MRHLWVAVLPLVLASSLHASTALAGNEAAAQALFEEAKKLVTQGKFAEACPKFAESNKLDRGAGTLIHLSNCYEKNNQTASAWASYKEASSAAQAQGRKDWEKLANQRAAALESKLAKLTIKVTPGETLSVSRDGVPLTDAALNLPTPVDVGPHTIEATAKDKQPFKTTANVSADGETVVVMIPKLEPATSATPAPVAPVVATTSPAPVDADRGGGSSSMKTVGLVIGGVGVAGLVVGAVTGLMAIGKASDAKESCPNDGRCNNKSAVDAADSANTLGLVSTIAFIGGGALAAAGVTIFLTAPEPRKTGQLRITPTIGGAVLGGSF